MPTPHNVTTLVLAVAGMGTRTKALAPRTPKCLIKLNNKPLIEYMLEEAVASGIEKVILVVNPSSRDRFESYVERRGSRRFPGLAFKFAVQVHPKGDGHAVFCAASHLEKEKLFAVRFPDDIVIGKQTAIQQMARVYASERAPVILLMRVPKNDVSRWGVISGKKIQDKPAVYAIDKFVEKPKVEEAPSNLIVVGSYLLDAATFRRIKTMGKKLPNKKDILRLAHVFASAISNGKKIVGVRMEGRRLDCGTIEGFKEAEDVMRTRGSLLTPKLPRP
jgi:UTP--glucose-1-phosphate uridylyltransferase